MLMLPLLYSYFHEGTRPFYIVHVNIFSFSALEKRALPAYLTVVKAAELVLYEGEALFF